MTSRCPVMTTPNGMTSYQLPTSIRFVGDTYVENTACRAVFAFERVNGPMFPE